MADDLGVSGCQHSSLRIELTCLLSRSQVSRIGPQHQAGSDSLLTAATFFKMRDKFFENSIDKKFMVSCVADLSPSPSDRRSHRKQTGRSVRTQLGIGNHQLDLSSRVQRRRPLPCQRFHPDPGSSTTRSSDFVGDCHHVTFAETAATTVRTGRPSSTGPLVAPGPTPPRSETALFRKSDRTRVVACCSRHRILIVRLHFYCSRSWRGRRGQSTSGGHAALGPVPARELRGFDRSFAFVVV